MDLERPPATKQKRQSVVSVNLLCVCACGKMVEKPRGGKKSWREGEGGSGGGEVATGRSSSADSAAHERTNNQLGQAETHSDQFLFQPTGALRLT